MREETKNFGGALLFVFYCMGVGIYLLLRPWAPDTGPASPYLRGFVSGLGLVHLVVGVNDFRLLFHRLPPAR